MGDHLAGVGRILRESEHAGEIVAPSAGQDAEHAARIDCQLGCHRANEAVAAERDRQRSAVGRLPCQLRGVQQVAGHVSRVVDTEACEGHLDTRQRATRPAAAGRRVDDQAGGRHGSRVLRSSPRPP